MSEYSLGKDECFVTEVELQVEGRSVKVLIDTGAGGNFLREDYLSTAKIAHIQQSK
jgi:hypothetical protein